MDGTMILVLETPNGEHFNIVPAMYMNKGGGDPNMGQKPIGMIGWWGVCGARWSSEGGGLCDLPVRFKALAITPICWRPIDVSNAQIESLKRRFYYKDDIDHDI